MSEDVNETEQIGKIKDIEPDGDIGEHTAQWFQSTLINAIIAVPEADRDKMLRIRGRLYVLRDIFGLSEDDIIALAEEYEIADHVSDVFEVGE